MAANKNPIKRTSQAMDNLSYDETFDQNSQLILGYDGADLQRVKVNSDGELITNTEPAGIDIEGGGQVAVGVAAVEATFTGTPKSIIISADTANTGTLYVGKAAVTSAGANAMAFLSPGESLTLDYDDTTNAVYVVASVAAQNFWKGALL